MRVDKGEPVPVRVSDAGAPVDGEMIVGLDQDRGTTVADPRCFDVDIRAPRPARAGCRMEPGCRDRAVGGQREQRVAESEHDELRCIHVGQLVGSREIEVVPVEGPPCVDVGGEMFGMLVAISFVFLSDIVRSEFSGLYQP